METILFIIDLSFSRKTNFRGGRRIGGTTQILCKNPESEWICLEPDPKLRTEIDQKIKTGQLPKNCQARGGTIKTLDSTKRFDTIIYIDVLEHIEDDHAEVLSACQLLNSKGKLVTLSPAHQFLYSPFDHQIGHYRRYNREMLKALTPPDCKVVKLLYLDSIGMLTSLSNRLFLRHGLPTSQQIRFWDRNLVPVSRAVDPLIGFSTGRSILCVWEKADV